MGDGFSGFRELETHSAQFLFMLCMALLEAVGNFVVGLLRFAQRRRQGVDLLVCFLDGPGEFARLGFAGFDLRLKLDAPRSQTLDVELQSIDGLGLDSEVRIEILDNGLAVMDRCDFRIERHGLEIEVDTRIGTLFGRRFPPGWQLQLGGSLLIVRD